jgi:hypothetical protein
MKNLNKTKFDSSKKNLLVIVACFIFSLGYGSIQNHNLLQNKGGDKNKKVSIDTTDCLEIIGQFDCAVKDFTGFYNVKLILDNTVVATQTLSMKKGFGFVLAKNMYYTIKIERRGYIPRIFSVSTKVDGELDEKNTYVYSFETSLLREDLGGLFEDDNIDFPFALISYNKNCDCFEHSKEYTASLIQKMISNIIYGI